MMRRSLLVLSFFALIGSHCLAQLPVNVRAIYLEENFDQPIDLVYELGTAGEDQWISNSLDKHTHWVQRNDSDSCARGGYIALPAGDANCPAAEIYSPVIHTNGCGSLEISFKRRFLRSGTKAELQLYSLNLRGERQLLQVEEHVSKIDDDCESVVVYAEGVEAESRIILRGPSLCSGLLIDNFKVRSPAISSEIASPSSGQITLARGASQVFSASAETILPNISFTWALRKANAEGEPQLFEGQEVSIPFEHTGLYEVILLATDGCSYDITPPKVEVWVSDSITRITSPEGDRRIPLIIDSIPQDQLFTGEVQDPNGLVHSIVWFNGSEMLCSESVTPGFASHITSCNISFDKTQRTAIVLQSLDEMGHVINEDAQVVWVVPDIKAVVVAPTRNREYELGDHVNLAGTVFGKYANHQTNTYSWIIDGVLYPGKLVSFTPSRHGSFTAKFIARNSDLLIGDEDAVSFFVNDPNHHPYPVMIHPKRDYTLPPGGDMFFEASYGDVPPNQRSLYWEIVEASTEELLASGDGPVLGRVAFPHVGVYLAHLYLRGGETERLVVTRTITVAEASPGSRNPETPRPLEDGLFQGLELDQEHYFQTTVGRDGQTIKMTMDFGEGAQLVFYPPNGEPIVRCITGRHTIQLSGLPAGNYTWGVIPGGDCVPAGKLGKKEGFSFSINVLSPALFFSDIVENKDVSTQIGVVNPNNEIAEITILGYDSNGHILCQSSFEIPAHGSYRDSAAHIFGAKAKDVTWSRVDSTATLVGFSRTVSIDQMQAYAVSAANLLQPELYVPHIAEDTNTWYTQARVVNGQDASIDSKIVTRAQTKPLNNTESFSKDSVDFIERLGGTISSEDNWAEFRDQSFEATLAGNEIFGTKDGTQQVVGLGLAGSVADNPNFTSGSGRIYFTHITNSAEFWTGLALVNRGSIPQNAEIKAFNKDGVQIGDTGLLAMGAGEKIVGTPVKLLGLANIPTSDVGWLEVNADANVTGYELFGTLSGGDRLAGIEGITDIRKNICLPYVDNTGTLWHGMALVNVTDEPCALTLTLRSEGGVALAQVTNQRLAGKEKRIFTLEELFTTIPADASWLEVNGTMELVGFEIFGDRANQHMSGIIAQ